MAAPASAVPAEKIISDEAAEASRARLASLSRLVIKPEVAGSDTLEGLVREMLKPMLRDWLDTNLPDLVEAMVAKEIARITGQR
jgi:cell pole-organizing protein PopZ